MLTDRVQIPDEKASSTSQMLSKLYESVVCPLTRRGKEVYKWTRKGALWGVITLGPFTLGLAEGSVGIRYLNIRSQETCNYERDHAGLFNCTFDLKAYEPSVCRATNVADPSPGDYFPLTCFNDTNYTTQLALIFNASDYGDTMAGNWYPIKARDVLIWTPFLGIGAAALAGGIYGLFKTLPPEDDQQDGLDQPLVKTLTK